MQYTMTGGLLFGGCAGLSVQYDYLAKFSVGSSVYDCRNARIGILTNVFIKKIRVVNSGGTIMYVDTMNRSYNEDDLCIHSDAASLAETYWQNQINQLTYELEHCNT